MVKVSRNVYHATLCRLAQQLALLFALLVLPGVFDNERSARVVFPMDSLAGCCPASHKNCSYNQLVDD